MKLKRALGIVICSLLALIIITRIPPVERFISKNFGPFSTTLDPDVFIRLYDPLIEKALWSYNNEYYLPFVRDFSESSRALMSEELFQKGFVRRYKDKYGKYISKTLVPEECVFDDEIVFLNYLGEFEKDKEVMITVTFTARHSTYRIHNIVFR